MHPATFAKTPCFFARRQQGARMSVSAYIFLKGKKYLRKKNKGLFYESYEKRPRVNQYKIAFYLLAPLRPAKTYTLSERLRVRTKMANDAASKDSQMPTCAGSGTCAKFHARANVSV